VYECCINVFDVILFCLSAMAIDMMVSLKVANVMVKECIYLFKVIATMAPGRTIAEMAKESYYMLPEATRILNGQAHMKALGLPINSMAKAHFNILMETTTQAIG